MEIRIGTSGWSYYHWKKIFYPEGLANTKWLQYYSNYFNTVELNSSFYKLPKKQSIVNWANKTPDKFVFSVKASRFITHIKRLTDIKESLETFLDAISNLGNKLGPILFQLPSNFIKDTATLNGFADLLSSDYQYVIEFRHPSWFDDEIFSILHEKNIAVCISSSPAAGGSSPNFPYSETITANFVFIRMHGSTQLYGSKYNPSEMNSWAKKIKKWHKQNLNTYIYFNNDSFGYAIQNAVELNELLGPTLEQSGTRYTKQKK